MDYTAEELEDLAEMRELRARLRACADARVAACEQMPPPETWLDIPRQSRAIEAADRMVVRLYSPPPRRRSQRKTPASPPHANGTSVPGEVSAKLMNEAKPADATDIHVASAKVAASAELSDADLVADATETSIEAITEVTRRCAEWAGVWPDGEAYSPEDGNARRHAVTQGLELPGDAAVAPEAWLNGEILLRLNLIACRSAQATGAWFDKTPYTECKLDYFSLSANYDTGLDHPADNEQPAPPGIPWWFVRKKPPP